MEVRTTEVKFMNVIPKRMRRLRNIGSNVYWLGDEVHEECGIPSTIHMENSEGRHVVKWKLLKM